MPEGDSVFRAGKQLERALVGQVLTRGEFRHPALATVDLAGHEVMSIRTVGKHIFTRFSGDLSLHSHLRMDGSWKIYAVGEKWRMPAHHARVILATADTQAVGFRLHDLKLGSIKDEVQLIGHLGPDLLDPLWTDEQTTRALANLTAQPHRELGLALLDQRIMAGIGNVYKTEICFLLGVTPWTPVSAVDPEKTVKLARKLLLANAWRAVRSTTGELAGGRQYWVYERTRRGCFRCGNGVLVAKQGEGTQVRPTWFCPHCQSGPAPQR